MDKTITLNCNHIHEAMYEILAFARVNKYSIARDPSENFVYCHGKIISTGLFRCDCVYDYVREVYGFTFYLNKIKEVL